jgi:hypothetical protein
MPTPIPCIGNAACFYAIAFLLALAVCVASPWIGAASPRDAGLGGARGWLAQRNRRSRTRPRRPDGWALAVAQNDWLFVLARARSRRYADASPPQIAAELGADYIVTGTPQSEGARIRVTATLLSMLKAGNRSGESAGRVSRRTCSLFSGKRPRRSLESLRPTGRPDRPGPWPRYVGHGGL